MSASFHRPTSAPSRPINPASRFPNLRGGTAWTRAPSSSSPRTKTRSGPRRVRGGRGGRFWGGGGGAAVYSQHAFAVYPLATQARGAKGIVAPAKNFGHDLDAMLAAITPETRIVFIANPNNPTGTFVQGAALEAFVGRVPREVLVVIDEAYNDYLPAALRYDSVAWLAKHHNLLITRTFSKVYALAGLRVGFGLCDPKIADLLKPVRQPFHVHNLALAAAVAAL